MPTGVKVILHCFSMADRVDECLAHPDWWFSFAGNVTYPKAEALRAARCAVPAGRLLVETDAPYLSPQPMRGKPNVPANVVAHGAGARARAPGQLRGPRAEIEATPPPYSDGERAPPLTCDCGASSARTSSSTATSST